MYEGWAEAIVIVRVYILSNKNYCGRMENEFALSVEELYERTE